MTDTPEQREAERIVAEWFSLGGYARMSRLKPRIATALTTAHERGHTQGFNDGVGVAIPTAIRVVDDSRMIDTTQLSGQIESRLEALKKPHTPEPAAGPTDSERIQWNHDCNAMQANVRFWLPTVTACPMCGMPADHPESIRAAMKHEG